MGDGAGASLVVSEGAKDTTMGTRKPCVHSDKARPLLALAGAEIVLRRPVI